MAYSLDFRQRVFKIKQEEELTFEQVSKRFGVSMRSLFNWSNRIEPRATRDRPATKIEMEKLEEDVRQRPDDFQYERAERFKVSPNAILYALRRLKISHKKNSISPQSK